MKIVYCNPSLHIPGGIERVLSVKANYFAEKLGHEIHIVITDGKDATPFFYLSASIKIHQLHINYDEWSPWYFRFFTYFRKRRKHRKSLDLLLNQINPDITVFLVRREVNFAHKLTDRSVKIAENHIDKNRYLSSINPFLSKYIPKFVIEFWKEQFVKKLNKLDRFIILTEEDKLAWNDLNNVKVIPNPLTFVPNGTSSCLSKQVIAVGRYDRQKGFDLLLSAWKLVVENHHTWILKIYGDGPMRKELEIQVKQEKLSNCCFLEYPTHEIADKYLESSIFVLSSRFEGFGLVLVEAMACGLPVVSFACPCGPCDIINNQQDGILVEKENVSQLASAISDLISNEERRKLMGNYAKENVQRYRIENIALLWQELFEEYKMKKNE